MNIMETINKAVLLVKCGKTAQAEKIYLQILSKYPNDIRVLPFLGWLYIQTRRYKEAAEIFERINHHTNDINIITGLGIAYYYLSRDREAYRYLKIAADKNPTLDILEKLITCTCDKLNKPETILKYAQIMKEKYPDSPRTWECYILAELCAGHFEAAETYCEEKLLKNPNSHVLYTSAGLIQEVMYSNYKLALECYLKANQLCETTSSLYNLGLIYSRLKNYTEAEKYMLKAQQKVPSDPTLNTALYLLYARKQDFQNAYKYFAKSALNYGSGAEINHHWHGENSINDILYVYADQGIGDIIMYSRYLPFLQDKFKKIILGVPDELKDLYKENFHSFQIVSTNKNIKYDKSVLISFLPYYLNMNFFEQIPASNGYLKLTNEYSNLLNINFNENKFKAGIVWEAGGTGLRGPLDRTINVKLLKNLINIEDTDFYSLQVNAAMKINDYFPQVTDLEGTLKDFIHTAAAIKNLDILVTVDTSVAHLAGAMGKKVLIMIPYANDWRWFESKQNVKWYSSSELFFQKTPGDWIEVLERVQERVIELRNLFYTNF